MTDQHKYRMRPKPTPWHYQENSDAYTHIVRAADNQFVCQMPQDTSGVAEGEARLIAAAPAMRDLLTRLAENCGTFTNNEISALCRAALPPTEGASSK